MGPEELADRAGRWMPQPTGYRAFIPKPLPPEPPLRVDDELLRLLESSALALGRLDGATDALPNPDLFVGMYARREALLSSQIEGTQASLDELLVHEVSQLRLAPNPIREVVNYVAAMEYGLTRLETLPLSLRLFKEIHGMLLEGVRGKEYRGEFRTQQNWVGPPGCTLREARYVPPPVGEMHRALHDLEKFIHSAHTFTPLVLAGLVHAQFETIHPFVDGNGRIGRLIITFLLCREGILKRPLLYLSAFLKQNRDDYYERLTAIREHGDWESWIKFFLRGVTEVGDRASRTARTLVELREQHRSRIQAEGKGAANALRLLDLCYSHPILNVNLAAAGLHVTFTTANNLFKRLVGLGILTLSSREKRNRWFRYEPYLEILREGTEPLPF